MTMARAYASGRGSRSISPWTILKARNRTNSVGPGQDRAEGVPLLRVLSDEDLEPLHDLLHEVPDTVSSGATFASGRLDGWVDVHVVSVLVHAPAVGGEQRCSSAAGDRGRSRGDHRPAPEEANVGPRTVWQVTDQRHQTVAVEHLVDGADRRAAGRDDVQPVNRAGLHHGVVQRTRKGLRYYGDPVAQDAGQSAGEVPRTHVRQGQYGSPPSLERSCDVFGAPNRQETWDVLAAKAAHEQEVGKHAAVVPERLPRHPRHLGVVFRQVQ